MSKKVKIGIVLIVLFFILATVFSFQGMVKQTSYYSEINEKTDLILIENMLSELSFSEEIQENIPATEFLEQIKYLKYNYPSKIISFMEEANSKLKEMDKSFVSEYKNGYGFEELLYGLCENYDDFNTSYLIGDDENMEYSKESSDNLYFSLLEKFTSANYESLESEFSTLLNQYKFTESYNHKIANLYHDLGVLSHNTNLSDSELIESLYDPCTCVIKTMSMFPENRIEIIEDKNVPYINFSLAVNVVSCETKTISSESEDYTGIYKQIFDRYLTVPEPSLYTFDITKVTFSSDEEELFDAYLLTEGDNIYHFYTIKPQDETKHYQSLADKVQ